MAGDEEGLTADEKVQRSVGRTFRGTFLLLVLLGGLGAWGSLGFFRLQEGEAAVLLLFGKHTGTLNEAGWKLVAPPPFMERHIVESRKLHVMDFGFRGREDENTPGPQLLEATMQTGDSNIVRLSFSVEYSYKDPFGVLFRVRDTNAVVRDASQAAMREVVARMTVDDVLREQRALVTSDVENLLQDILDSYGSGLRVESVQLQGVEPPARVRAAFDAVMESGQDATRLVNEAEGYRNEMVPKSHAEAAELVAAAEAYRDSKIAEATGEAARFKAVATEYAKAPEVTRKRLYLETMEVILPEVDKIIIEPGTTQVLPYLPLGQKGGERP